MKVYQKEIPFKKVKLILESKEEAEALREMSDFFTKEMLKEGVISEELYELSIKLSNSFFNSMVEVPLTEQEKCQLLNDQE